MSSDLIEKIRAADPVREHEVRIVLARIGDRDVRRPTPIDSVDPAKRLRHRPLRALAVTGTGIAVVVIVAFALLSGGRAHNADAAVMRRAVAALTPPANSIVHIRQRLVQGSSTVTTESWQESGDPGQFRYRQISSYCPAFVTEQSATTDETEELDPSNGTIYVTPRNAAEVAQSAPAGGLGSLFDPSGKFARAVQDGAATVVGDRTINNRETQEIAWPVSDAANDPTSEAHNELYVDAKTGVPVAYRTGGGKLDGTGGSTELISFEAYEFLPDSRSAEQDLTVSGAYPGAQRMHLSAAAVAQHRQAAQRALCGAVG